MKIKRMQVVLPYFFYSFLLFFLHKKHFSACFCGSNQVTKFLKLYLKNHAIGVFTYTFHSHLYLMWMYLEAYTGQGFPYTSLDA